MKEKQNHVKLLKRQIDSYSQELRERNNTIEDKDKRINELKTKTQELEKFKFVLDYKIKELKGLINPREQEIQKLQDQEEKMKQELKHFARVNSNLSLIVDDLKMRQEGLSNECAALRKKVESLQAKKKQFRNDIFECHAHL